MMQLDALAAASEAVAEVCSYLSQLLQQLQLPRPVSVRTPPCALTAFGFAELLWVVIAERW